MVNESKSHWKPCPRGKWLGFELDLECGYISVPADKVEKLKSCLATARDAQCIRAKDLTSIIAKIIFMRLGVGPLARLRTRRMYSLLDMRVSWFDQLPKLEDVRQEFVFWQDCIEFFNGQRLWKSPSVVRVVYSDASGTGYAGYTVEHGYHIALGKLSEEEKRRSSTWRELAAVAKIVEAVSCKLKDNRVKWTRMLCVLLVLVVEIGSCKRLL